VFTIIDTRPTEFRTVAVPNTVPRSVCPDGTLYTCVPVSSHIVIVVVRRCGFTISICWTV
jgi:hypothetical protein